MRTSGTRKLRAALAAAWLSGLAAIAQGAAVDGNAPAAPGDDAGTSELDPLFRDPPASKRTIPPTRETNTPKRSTLERPPLTPPDLTTENPELQRLKDQIAVREYEVVLEDLEHRISRIEREQQRYARELAVPLMLQGDALTGLGRYDAALDSYSRAVHVLRVNDGLNAPEQVAAVYREANVLKILGDQPGANDREEYAFGVLQRSYGPVSPELLPGLYHLADWYSKTNNPYPARRLYKQAITIVERTYGDDSMELIAGLSGVAETYFRAEFPPFVSPTRPQDQPVLTQRPLGNSAPIIDSTRAPNARSVGEGERALKRIVRLRAARAEDDPAALVDAYLKLADWNLLFDKQRDAHRLYLEARAVMAEQSELAAKQLMSSPELLHFQRPINPKPPPPHLRGDAKTGFVELEFDVSSRGTIQRIRTRASQPPGLMDFRVRKSMRSARYRPVLVNDELKISFGQTYRYEYTYFEALNKPDPSLPVPDDEERDPDPLNAPAAASVSSDSDALGYAYRAGVSSPNATR